MSSRTRSRIGFALFLFIPILVGARSSAAFPDEGVWSPSFDLEPLDGPVHCLLEHDGLLFIGGEFATAGGLPASNIVAWNDGGWVPLGDGLPGPVHCLTVHEGRLVVGGEFIFVDGSIVMNLAIWDGSSWSGLDMGPAGAVRALAVHEGQLVVGGEFLSAGATSMSRLGRWNGSAWEELGGGISGTVHSLLSRGDELVVGGEFAFAGDVPANMIAAWDGQEWSGLADGFNAGVFALCEFQGQLYAVGEFTSSGGLNCSGIGRWDGSSWLGLFRGLEQGYPSTAGYAILPRGDELYVAGNFHQAGGDDHDMFARWSGEYWLFGEDTFNRPIRALCEYRGLPYAGGDFELETGAAWSHLVCGLPGQFWESPRWNGLGGGLATPAESVLALGDTLYLGGIDRHQATLGPGLFAWTDGAWHARPFSLGPMIVETRALSALGDRLLVCGRFPHAETGVPRYLAIREDGEWEFLLEGPGEDWLSAGTNVQPWGDGFALVVSARDGNDLHVFSRIHRGRGEDWEALGETWNGEISAMTLHEGKLVVAGSFTDLDGAGPYLAIHDGESWSSHPEPPNGPVHALAKYEGALVAGGDFLACGEQALGRLGLWDGLAWHPLGGGPGGEVRTLQLFKGALAAGGDFPGGLALWRDGLWTTPAGGLDGIVNRITCSGGRLFALGDFGMAGATPSVGLALWEQDFTPVDVSSFRLERGDGHLRISWRLAADAGETMRLDLRAEQDGLNWSPPIRHDGMDEWHCEDPRPLDRPDRPVTYRLGNVEADGHWRLLREETLLPGALAGERAWLRAVDNPARGGARIRLDPGRSRAGRLEVYDIGGRRVASLMEGALPAGSSEFAWDGRDERGRVAAAGLYLVSLELPGRRITSRLLLLR